MVKKYGLALPIKKSHLETGNPALKIPVLTMTSWAEFICKNNCFHILVGLLRPDPPRERAILSKFWEQFQESCPNHDIFKMASENQIDLQAAVPCCLHGDEGRGRKHQPYLVTSWRSLIGRGLEPSETGKRQRGVKKRYIKQECNYRGHSYTTRFLIAGLRTVDYTNHNSNVFDALMEMCATESNHMSRVGVLNLAGERRWLVTLFITGDWPWLCESG